MNLKSVFTSLAAAAAATISTGAFAVEGTVTCPSGSEARYSSNNKVLTCAKVQTKIVDSRCPNPTYALRRGPGVDMCDPNQGAVDAGKLAKNLGIPGGNSNSVRTVAEWPLEWGVPPNALSETVENLLGDRKVKATRLPDNAGQQDKFKLELTSFVYPNGNTLGLPYVGDPSKGVACKNGFDTHVTDRGLRCSQLVATKVADCNVAWTIHHVNGKDYCTAPLTGARGDFTIPQGEVIPGNPADHGWSLKQDAIGNNDNWVKVARDVPVARN